MGTLGNNELIMITLIYTKEIIHLSGPVDERQKVDLPTRYSKIIWYVRLRLKYTNMYIPVYWQNFSYESYGVNQYSIGIIFGSSDHVFFPDFLFCFTKFKRI